MRHLPAPSARASRDSVPPLLLRSLHQGLARQRVHETHRLSCVSIADLRRLGALFSITISISIIVIGRRGSRDEMHQPSSRMLVARRSTRLWRCVSLGASVVDVHAPSMLQSSSRMLVGGIDGSDDHSPSHRVRDRHRQRAPSKLEHQERRRQQGSVLSSRQGRASDIVESSVRDRCGRSAVPRNGADSARRERLSARSNVLGRVRASSRLVPSRIHRPPPR